LSHISKDIVFVLHSNLAGVTNMITKHHYFTFHACALYVFGVMANYALTCVTVFAH